MDKLFESYSQKRTELSHQHQSVFQILIFLVIYFRGIVCVKSNELEKTF